MAAAAVTRFCVRCAAEYKSGTKHCEQCAGNPILHFRCSSTTWEGRYNLWYRDHRPTCATCNPKIESKSEQKRDQKAVAKSVALHDAFRGTTSRHTHASLSN